MQLDEKLLEKICFNITFSLQLLLPSLWAFEVEESDNQENSTGPQTEPGKEIVQQNRSMRPQRVDHLDQNSSRIREQSTAFPHFPPVDRGIPGSEPEV